jgi:PiT family inorganic phosphate transporter
MATPATLASKSILDEKLKKSSPGRIGGVAFGILLFGGVLYIVHRLSTDLAIVHTKSIFPYFLLGIALLMALGFEFVNGFHDTANAVATVIYTHSLEPHVAVVWSGIWNFIGVLMSSGAVAYSVITLLPVELTLKVSRGSGFAMVFALSVAAILWNLTTWYLGLPTSSSHTMIGSIIGVGITNQLLHRASGVSGLDLEQVMKVFKALLFSPVVGLIGAALLFLLFRIALRDPQLYEAPKGAAPPPFYIRALLILTCTGVSFAHGSNDGQKGMGLIMLILVGTVPTAYALNHAITNSEVTTFVAVSHQVEDTIANYVDTNIVIAESESELEHFLSTRQWTPGTMLALRQTVNDIQNEVVRYGRLDKVPAEMQANVRNQMYLVGETMRLIPKFGPQVSDDAKKIFANYQGFLDRSTKFIPLWVKVAVALALGLGTMVGWKRIVVTVGEKIGKEHMTYAQGAVAQLVAMCTILAADNFGLPVSTTHVLSSGVAGTMVVNNSGLHLSTLRNIALTWFFTLPAAALLSGALYWLFNMFAK